ncbi:MAG: DUF2096 family protein [Candidatus Bathyarchaeota archaeon]
MNYEYLWKIVEELSAELTGKGVAIPPELVDDLKSAKVYISIHKMNSTELHISEKIEIYMESLESNLLYLAESNVGKDYADEWLKKIYRAQTEKTPEPPAASTRFVSAIPKGEHWIKINLLGLMVDKDVCELLKTLNLSSTAQEGGYLLVHGKEENVKTFVKKVGEKIGRKKP